VNQVIIKGMERKPENRPQTVQEWLYLLPKAQNLLNETNSITVRDVKDCMILQGSWLNTINSVLIFEVIIAFQVSLICL
jgi:hypothetical protein